MNPDTCGRGDSIPIRICVAAETFKSGRKLYGFKNIRIRVHGALGIHNKRGFIGSFDAF